MFHDSLFSFGWRRVETTGFKREKPRRFSSAGFFEIRNLRIRYFRNDAIGTTTSTTATTTTRAVTGSDSLLSIAFIIGNSFS